MECSEPGAIRDGELVACLAGETVRLAVSEHLTHCLSCSSQLATYRRIELKLMSKLYRWDCPPSQVLGEYQMGLLSQKRVSAVKRHLDSCVLCVADVATLTAFLANDPMLELMPQMIASLPPVVANNHQHAAAAKRALDQLSEQSLTGVRRIVAALLPPQPRLAYQRGSTSQPIIWPRRYEAEDITVSIQVERGGSRNDALQLIGFVMRKGANIGELQGIPVQLSLVATGEKALYVQTIDELGNFIFSSLAPETYMLELQFPEGVIVIDQLLVAMQE